MRGKASGRWLLWIIVAALPAGGKLLAQSAPLPPALGERPQEIAPGGRPAAAAPAGSLESSMDS